MSLTVDVQQHPTGRAPHWLEAAAWLLLALLLGGAFWLLLKACELRLLQDAPLLQFCRAAAPAPGADPALAAEIARQAALEAEIERLELALLRAPDCPQPSTSPAEAEVRPEAIPDDAWRESGRQLSRRLLGSQH